MNFAPEVLAFAKRRKIEQLEDKVQRAAKCTHPSGNRRFHHLVFQIEDEKVCAITDLTTGETSVTQTLGTNEFLVWEVCESCGGSGCKSCAGKGEIRVRRKLK